MPSIVARIRRAPLLTLAILLAVVKSIQFAIDSTALFYFDSGSFILNALGLAFVSERSYVYGYLIRIFAVPFHSLRAIIAMQLVMGGVTAWVLGLVLLSFLKVRAWIAILACLNVVAQTMCPAYVRARTLSFYLLVLQGGMAVGATLWGALAQRIGVPDALGVAAVTLALGVLALRGHRITTGELELAPAVVRD